MPSIGHKTETEKWPFTLTFILKTAALDFVVAEDTTHAFRIVQYVIDVNDA